MADRNPSSHPLESMLDLAAQQMLSDQSTKDNLPDRMFYSGVWNDAYPAILVRDPILPDSAKIQLLYLMQEARSNPYGANPLPSVEKTSRDLSKSPTTVVRDRAIIRMTRWASQCQRVRDTQGRIRGLIWMLHGEPASLAEATALDSEHMELLEQASGGHFDRIARRAARLVLAAIDHDIGSGRDPLESVNPMERRLEALQTLKRGSGRYFSGFFAEQDSNLETRANTAEKPVSKFETGGIERQKPISNFETGSQPIDFSGASNFETSEYRSSSSNNKKTTTTADRKKGDNSVVTHTASYRCSAEVLRGDIRDNTVVNTGPPLQWPTNFDDNRKRLVQRMLQHHLPDRPDDHQEVINALSAKLEDRSDPLRNLGYYVTRLCTLARTGKLCPVEPPSPPTSRSPPDEKLRISNLRGEIRSLQRLIESAQHSGADGVQVLETQLAQRQAQLCELEQTRH